MKKVDEINELKGLKEFFKRLKEKESIPFWDKSTFTGEELSILLDQFSKGYLKSNSIDISARRAMLISFENMLEIEGVKRVLIEKENVYRRATMRYDFKQRNLKKLEDLNHIHPENPNVFYNDNAHKFGQYRKALYYILINKKWLLDYIEVEESLSKRYDLTR